MIFYMVNKQSKKEKEKKTERKKKFSAGVSHIYC